GVHPLTAVGTDLLYAAVTKTAGTAIHSKTGNVDWRVGGLFAVGSVPTTVVTIWGLSRVPTQSPDITTINSLSLRVGVIHRGGGDLLTPSYSRLRRGPR